MFFFWAKVSSQKVLELKKNFVHLLYAWRVKPWTIFAKHSTLDVWQDSSEYASIYR